MEHFFMNNHTNAEKAGTMCACDLSIEKREQHVHIQK
jgi:hypothetical protein